MFPSTTPPRIGSLPRLTGRRRLPEPTGANYCAYQLQPASVAQYCLKCGSASIALLTRELGEWWWWCGDCGTLNPQLRFEVS